MHKLLVEEPELGSVMGELALRSTRDKSIAAIMKSMYEAWHETTRGFTTPVALVEIDNRRYVIGTFGEVNWVRNLREVREAIVTVGRRREAVRAVELSRPQAAAFFRDTLGPYVRKIPIGRWLLARLGAGEVLEDPNAAAERRPVFELHAVAAD